MLRYEFLDGSGLQTLQSVSHPNFAETMTVDLFLQQEIGQIQHHESRFDDLSIVADRLICSDSCIARTDTPDLTASFSSLSCEDDFKTARVRIGNGGALRVDAGVPVSFYDGDPADGGTLLGTTHTIFPMPPGLFEDVTIALPSSFDCDSTLYAVADDEGHLTSTQNECNEDNNTHAQSVELLFDSFVDMTLDVDVEFRDTTFNRQQNRLIVDSQATNISETPFDSPLLMVIENITELSVSVFNPDGFVPEGDPYYVFVDALLGLTKLAVGEQSPIRTMLFGNPLRQKVLFDHSWRGPNNRPPAFVSFPPTSAVVDRPYLHTAVARDPEEQPITYGLIESPLGMSIDDTSGEMNWTPVFEDIGLHNVRISAADDRGGQASQRYTIQVTPEPVNRPPVFNSAPITQVLPGATYGYQARATDRDGDTLTFSKLDGPEALTVSPDGLAEWEFALPGDYPVGIRVADDQGAYADQTYILTAGDTPTNPNAPVLFGTPGVIAAVGQQYIYQPVASDPDPDDTLTFSQPTAPAGMDITPGTGRVAWVPTSDQLGSHDVARKRPAGPWVSSVGVG